MNDLNENPLKLQVFADDSHNNTNICDKMSYENHEKQIHYLLHDKCVLMSILIDHLCNIFEATEHMDRYLCLYGFPRGYW